ncbi:transglutaminase-like cysteine peptidase [Neptuniibacter sp. CAU 1671]|uniref:transglutaminase-like cysteine peptidase n=1 Tax=Neptuniibacter sp. CAU 1671 TaxID=3032593 RepID=UPI0023DC22CE|nr:transglutaminase-like cysteine peptidase [Neptuniibacter sp. CAU 1671]MDF2182848.1 transglutaminase-like cysteine peptidase [Neptuniibacter sp. CAU 1671]
MLRLGQRLRCMLWLVLALAAPQLYAGNLVNFSEGLLYRVEQKFGQTAVLRLKALETLVREKRDLTDLDKVREVNDFFNLVPYYTDLQHWGVEDYWATPFEKLTTFGGDCEDYAIAKYFTLRELGIPDNKLRITYVKALNWNQAHMVLTYYPVEDEIPLVLDNLNPDLLPANQRRDLVPVYSFNGDGLWLAKGRGTGQRVGGSSRLKMWQDLQNRMAK